MLAGNSCKDMCADFFNYGGLLVVKRNIVCVLTLTVTIFFDLIGVKTREGSRSRIRRGFNIVQGRFSRLAKTAVSLLIYSHTRRPCAFTQRTSCYSS